MNRLNQPNLSEKNRNPTLHLPTTPCDSWAAGWTRYQESKKKTAGLLTAGEMPDHLRFLPPPHLASRGSDCSTAKIPCSYRKNRWSTWIIRNFVSGVPWSTCRSCFAGNGTVVPPFHQPSDWENTVGIDHGTTLHL